MLTLCPSISTSQVKEIAALLVTNFKLKSETKFILIYLNLRIFYFEVCTSWNQR